MGIFGQITSVYAPYLEASFDLKIATPVFYALSLHGTSFPILVLLACLCPYIQSVSLVNLFVVIGLHHGLQTTSGCGAYRA